jgi:hypothetical protein
LRVLATKWFSRFARKERIVDRQLCEAVRRAEQGSLDGDLGGNLIKQRVARAGGGRSGGFRRLIAYQTRRRSVFLYGFAKSDRDNIDDKELADLRKLAKRFLSLTEGEIETALHESELKELPYDGEEEG